MHARSLLALLLLVILSGCAKRDDAANAEAERDRKFAQMMSGSVMAGYSTRDNKPGLSGEERYHIDRVSRLTGDTWLFQSRMKYRDTEMPVPVPVTIKWAGDTPVITLTDLSIPGLGTYTARIVLYRDRYAGTWSGAKGGGQMFGKIVRSAAP